MALDMAHIVTPSPSGVEGRDGVYFHMFMTTPWVTRLVSGSPATTRCFKVGSRLHNLTSHNRHFSCWDYLRNQPGYITYFCLHLCGVEWPLARCHGTGGSKRYHVITKHSFWPCWSAAGELTINKDIQPFCWYIMALTTLFYDVVTESEDLKTIKKWIKETSWVSAQTSSLTRGLFR